LRSRGLGPAGRSSARGRAPVRLASLVSAKTEVYRAMQQAAIDKAKFARHSGVAPEAAVEGTPAVLMVSI